MNTTYVYVWIFLDVTTPTVARTWKIMHTYTCVYIYMNAIIHMYLVDQKNENINTMQSTFGDATTINHEMTCCCCCCNLNDHCKANWRFSPWRSWGEPLRFFWHIMSTHKKVPLLENVERFNTGIHLTFETQTPHKNIQFMVFRIASRKASCIPSDHKMCLV